MAKFVMNRGKVGKLFPPWFRKRENIVALLLVLIMLMLHLVVINRPRDQICDAKYYVAEANVILEIAGEDISPYYWAILHEEGSDSREEYINEFYKGHGPVAKLCIAGGIKVFGDNPVGWRIFPILFGLVAIILIYLICQELTSKKWLPLIVTFIFAFENMCFVMSGIAMLDVFAFTLVLTSFLVYLRGRYVFAGTILALAVLTKETAAFGCGVILLHWFLTTRGTSNWGGVKFLIAVPVTYMMLSPLLDFIAVREIIYAWDRIGYLFSGVNDAIPQWDSGTSQYWVSRGAIHSWEWMMAPNSWIVWHNPTYQIQPSWTLWILIMPAMCYALYKAIRHNRSSFYLFSFIWFICVCLPFYVADLGFSKILYPYYFYPAVGAVCLVVGYAIDDLLSFAAKRNDIKVRWVLSAPVILWMVAHFVLFWVMSPVIT